MMSLTLLCRTVSVATLGACLLFALPAWSAHHDLEPTSSPVASEPGGVAEARALIDAGRFAEALNILGPLVSGSVVEANAVFLYGLAAVGAAQHPQVTEENRKRYRSPILPTNLISRLTLGLGKEPVRRHRDDGFGFAAWPRDRRHLGRGIGV